jgi:glycosyltransferase involved in cell wall biosynthesis
MNSPLVSIVIPTFNRAHLISDTIESILAQTYPNWECIVVNDSSTDNTIEVVNEYVKKDSRFQLHSLPAERLRGGNDARNYGFEISQGEYIKWFDSDDIMYPNFLEVQMSILIDNPKLDFCACQWEYFYENGQMAKNYINLKPKNHPLYSYFIDGHVFQTNSPLWKKFFLTNKSLFDPKIVRSQEADFHLRMLSFSPQYITHADFLYKVRRGHESIETTSSDLKKQLSVLNYFQNALKIIEQNTFEGKFKLQQYLIFRILGQVYSVASQEKNIFSRLKYFHFHKTIFKYRSHLGIRTFFKTQLGLCLLVFFKKGYRFMLLKQFDLRKK